MSTNWQNIWKKIDDLEDELDFLHTWSTSETYFFNFFKGVHGFEKQEEVSCQFAAILDQQLILFDELDGK